MCDQKWHFHQTLVHGRILTVDKLKTRGMQLINRCPLCNRTRKIQKISLTVVAGHRKFGASSRVLWSLWQIGFGPMYKTQHTGTCQTHINWKIILGALCTCSSLVRVDKKQGYIQCLVWSLDLASIMGRPVSKRSLVLIGVFCLEHNLFVYAFGLYHFCTCFYVFVRLP